MKELNWNRIIDVMSVVIINLFVAGSLLRAIVTPMAEGRWMTFVMAAICLIWDVLGLMMSRR